MLTTDLDDPGYGWNRSLPTTGASRSIRQLWSALDGRNLATDKMLTCGSARDICGMSAPPAVQGVAFAKVTHGAMAAGVTACKTAGSDKTCRNAAACRRGL
jgi:hypothetical protein